MNEQQQKLSTLMDDYRPTEQDRSVLNEVLDDVNQRYTLRRYQLISDIMRNEIPQRIRLDFAAEVMSSIAQEPSLQVSTSLPGKSQKETSWLWSVLFKPLAGLAVAASVAIVAVSSLHTGDTGLKQPEQLASANTSSQKVEQLASLPVIGNVLKVSTNTQGSVSTGGMNWKIKRNEPAIQMKLNTYLINHNEYSNSMQGIIPQARVVGFDAQN